LIAPAGSTSGGEVVMIGYSCTGASSGTIENGCGLKTGFLVFLDRDSDIASGMLKKLYDRMMMGRNFFVRWGDRRKSEKPCSGLG
jgi:hypothetical protein